MEFFEEIVKNNEGKINEHKRKLDLNIDQNAALSINKWLPDLSHEKIISHVAWSPNVIYLATGSEDCTVKIWMRDPEPSSKSLVVIKTL